MVPESRVNPYFKTAVSLALLALGMAMLALGAHDGIRVPGFLLTAGAFISTMVCLHNS